MTPVLRVIGPFRSASLHPRITHVFTYHDAEVSVPQDEEVAWR
jgi:hypothetical protein